MLDYINQLLSYIINHWFYSIVRAFTIDGSLWKPVVITIPVCITFLIFAAKLIKKFIWGAK